MEYRKLGNAGVRFSEIGLGSWLTFGHGVNDDTARACMRRAFELGVNFFDTADVYARGQSEVVCGEVLKDYRRQDWVIATKCFFPMSDNANDRGLSRKHIHESIDNSLGRLQTDYVDLYQCHRFDERVEMFEIVRAMDDLIRRGKILYWGVSEWPAECLRRACAVAREINACPPYSNQVEYSIAARRVETNDVQQTCRDSGLGMVLWSPLKQGMLTGKYSGGKIPSGTRAASDKMNYFIKEISRELADRVDRLRPIAEAHSMTLAQLAICWLLQRDAVTSVITGASRVEQVDENVDATGFTLAPADLAKIDEVFPAEDWP